MKIILRKSDSATSLLLFIYNNYSTKTSKESLKLSSLLEILKVFDKNETAVRMSLSRAVKVGVLINSKENGEVAYSLSELGRLSIDLWNEGAGSFWKRYELRHLPWDGKWHFLTLDSVSDKKQKAEISDGLQQLGFVLMSTNSWLCPYCKKDETAKLLRKYDLENGSVEVIGELNIRRNTTEFLEDTYHLKMLKDKYIEFIKTYEDKLSQIKEIYNEKQFIDSGQSLLLLHGLGWHFFNIASDDTALPKQFHPLYEGDLAAEIMKELRKLLVEASYKYLDRFE